MNKRLMLGALLAAVAISVAPGTAIAEPATPSCMWDAENGSCIQMPGNDFHHFTRCTRSEQDTVLGKVSCLEDPVNDIVNSLLDKGQG
ncbi:hypothetical protein [Mycobacterium noviomagense]|uniref:Uncharacterized protein n=1 Tax=Mycobacterium noviomagense TaxID=459858 RepID=A0A7I7PHA6_9MYCO|nr:hypothetical protein [Mycobacterium noviomagense]BBY07983.1 hypothetical protein MNVI_33010 [Mycobacterium noviomagense]